jgi:hypothetical protein
MNNGHPCGGLKPGPLGHEPSALLLDQWFSTTVLGHSGESWVPSKGATRL